MKKRILLVLLSLFFIIPVFSETDPLDDFEYVYKMAEKEFYRKNPEVERKKYLSKGVALGIHDVKNCLRKIKMPEKNIEILITEVTQSLYEEVMGINPSYNKGDNNPVENVSWLKCVIFCNKLSEKLGLTPCYSYKKTTATDKWKFDYNKMMDWKGSQWRTFNKDMECDFNANGFRLPTEEEWQYAAKGGKNYKYAGSNNLDEVGWYEENSGKKTHPVAQKKANGYGLYDMSGNVWEWVWDSNGSNSYRRYYCGGSYYNIYDIVDGCEVDSSRSRSASSQDYNMGFRIVRTVTD